MNDNAASRIHIRFPGDLEYIPAIRKFVADILQAENFSSKLAYRSEIIIDEICNNAVSFGCQSINASVDLECIVAAQQIEFVVRDEGGSSEHIHRLKTAVANAENTAQTLDIQQLNKHLGLEIVRMISDKVDISIDANHITSVRVVKSRESESDTAPHNPA
jgi:anti-sigma regulatory factor (Ser/Thr protein kinase)